VRWRVQGSVVLRRKGLRGEEPGVLLEIDERVEVEVDGVMGLRLMDGVVEVRRGGGGVWRAIVLGAMYLQ